MKDVALKVAKTLQWYEDFIDVNFPIFVFFSKIPPSKQKDESCLFCDIFIVFGDKDEAVLAEVEESSLNKYTQYLSETLPTKLSEILDGLYVEVRIISAKRTKEKLEADEDKIDKFLVLNSMIPNNAYVKRLYWALPFIDYEKPQPIRLVMNPVVKLIGIEGVVLSVPAVEMEIFVPEIL